MDIKSKTKIKASLFLGSLLWLVFGFNVAEASLITEYNVIELVNQARLENGLKILQPDKNLFKVASDKADDMLRQDYFAHTSPQGITPWTWFEKNSYDYKYAGENLAINFSSVEDQQKAWMASTTHRKNILDPNFEEIGIAVKKGIINGKLTTITVQAFGQQTALAKGNSGGKIAGERITEASWVSNTVPRVDAEAIRNFKSQLSGNETNLADSMMGIKNQKLVEYLEISFLVLLWAIMIASPAILIGNIVRLKLASKRNEEGLAVLNGTSQARYGEIMKTILSDPDKIKMLYLEQMKLKR